MSKLKMVEFEYFVKLTSQIIASSSLLGCMIDFIHFNCLLYTNKRTNLGEHTDIKTGLLIQKHSK